MSEPERRAECFCFLCEFLASVKLECCRYMAGKAHSEYQLFELSDAERREKLFSVCSAKIGVKIPALKVDPGKTRTARVGSDRIYPVGGGEKPIIRCRGEGRHYRGRAGRKVAFCGDTHTFFVRRAEVVSRATVGMDINKARNDEGTFRIDNTFGVAVAAVDDDPVAKSCFAFSESHAFGVTYYCVFY